MDLEECLASMQATLADADADLETVLGGQRERTSARIWQGDVRVDWEIDEMAGDCLLRPWLLRRLIVLHASVSIEADTLRVLAPGRVVAGLGPGHADLVATVGGASAVQLRAEMRFRNGRYLGGRETYAVVDRGRPVPFLELKVDVRSRQARTESPRTSPDQT